MKVYILSDSSNNGDSLAEELEKYNVNIIEKEITDPEEYRATLEDLLSRGGFDSIILAASDPVGMSISLNKRQEIKAALCNSREDLQSAKDNGANVIIIGKNADLEGIAASMAQASAASKKSIAGIFNPKKVADSQRVAGKAEKPNHIAKVQQKAQVEEPALPDEEDTAPPQKGLMNKIKYALGIEDEDSSDKRKDEK
jgi:ribose 5-phosphate isomerase RpiB